MTSTPTGSWPGPRSSPRLRATRDRLQDPATFAEEAARIARPADPSPPAPPPPGADLAPEALLDLILQQSPRRHNPLGPPPPRAAPSERSSIRSRRRMLSARTRARPSWSPASRRRWAKSSARSSITPSSRRLESLCARSPPPDPTPRDRSRSDDRAHRPDPRRARGRPAHGLAARDDRRLQAAGRAQRRDRGRPALDVPGRRFHVRTVPARRRLALAAGPGRPARRRHPSWRRPVPGSPAATISPPPPTRTIGGTSRPTRGGPTSARAPRRLISAWRARAC